MALGIQLGEDWFYNLHTGRWDDAEAPFLAQWKRLQNTMKRGKQTWLLGDFNAPAEIRNEGYDTMLEDGWFDTRTLAKRAIGDATVSGCIDGWQDAKQRHAMRMDYILADRLQGIQESTVVFDGTREEVLSDHFGVMVTTASKRSAGVLLPITALPSCFGIGCFSKEAYRFVDWLKEAGQSYWQILPLGPTGYGDSPYQSFSTFAGNPYLIDLETMIAEGLLTQEECDGMDFGKAPDRVSYEKLFQNRFPILKKAFARYTQDEAFTLFCQEQAFWLEDYALFMAIKADLGDVGLAQFPEELRCRKKDAIEQYQEKLETEVVFWKFVQFQFYRQWKKLKRYANASGIAIIGDLPIYVSADSSDVWANPELFSVDESGTPIEVAGCPPDGFSAEGQLWGNPVFRWEAHQKDGFRWWMQRLKHCFSLYDSLRIDHFRGFDAYYAIPYGEKNAIHGVWRDAPGRELFQRVREAFPDKLIIAEDLGFVTDSVRELLQTCGFPGMKVLQFAFDSRDTGAANDYLPHNYPENCVAYTGTHDNPTLVSWYQEISHREREMVRGYLCDRYTPEEELHMPMIALLMRSAANICIIPLQDYLGLNNKSRMNTPSTAGGNWQWRVTEAQLTEKLAKELLTITQQYGR